MVKKATSSYGVRDLNYKPESTMSLQGNHATTTKQHKIGDKVQLAVTATKVGHRMDSTGSHSAEFKIHNVKINDKDEVSGPNTKASKNDEDDSDSRQ